MRKLTIEDIKEKIKNTELTLLSTEYKGKKHKLKFRCSCGEEFYSSWDSINVSKKTCCNSCSAKKLRKKFAKSNNEFEQDLLSILGEEYKLISDYINNKTKIRILHTTCGEVWEVRPDVITHQKSSCPFCSRHAKMSRGELLIREYLLNNNIEFIEQYRIEECKNIKTLPFDFAIMEKERLKLLIEFDGQQHYQPKSFGGSTEQAEEEFKRTQANDKIKTQYCLDNDITLIRIPYWEIDNIDKILKELFK